MKFVGDSRFGTIVIMQDQGMIQEALTDLEGWTIRNGMKFNITECKVMHLGSNNMNFHYMLKAYQLGTSLEEKDLGVLVDGITKKHRYHATMKKTNASVGYMSHRLPKRQGSINAPERAEISPEALLSAVVKKDEALAAQVQREAVRRIRGSYQLWSPSPSEQQLRGDTVAFSK